MVPARPRLGQLLVEAGLISPEQLAAALQAQQRDPRRIGALLVEAGALDEIQLTQALSQQLNAPWVSLHHIDFSRQLLNLIPREIAEQFRLIPIYVRNVRGQGNTLYVAMDDPTNEQALRACASASRLPARAMIAPPSDIRNALRVYYGATAPEPRSASVSLIEVDAELLGDEDEVADAPSEVLGDEDEVPEPPRQDVISPDPPRPREESFAHIEIEVEAPAPPPPAPISAPAPSTPPPAPPVVVAASGVAPPVAVSPVAAPAPVAVPPVAAPSAALAPAPAAASGAGGGKLAGLSLETDVPFEGLEAMPPSGAPAAQRAPQKTISVTLLDGTTITLPARASKGIRRPRGAPKAEAEATPLPPVEAPREPPRGGDGAAAAEGPASDTSDQLTARDLIAALRAVSHGADASEILGDNAGWEALFAALLSLLLKKQVIADWEFVEEYKKI
jgi:type IV pilus assembly protein PilB